MTPDDLAVARSGATRRLAVPAAVFTVVIVLTLFGVARTPTLLKTLSSLGHSFPQQAPNPELAPRAAPAQAVPVAPSGPPIPSEVQRSQAAAKLGSAAYFREGGLLANAESEARQALTIWPGYQDAQQFLREIQPLATATAVALQAQAAAAAAEATRVALNPAIAVMSQHARAAGNELTIMGEIRNDGPVHAFWTVDAVLLNATGATVASGMVEANTAAQGTDKIWIWPPPAMAPGETHPYLVTIRNPPPHSRIVVRAAARAYASVYRVSQFLPPSPRTHTTFVPEPGGLGMRGTVTNIGSSPMEQHAIVWFLDGAGRVVDVKQQRKLDPAPLYPSVSTTTEDTTSVPGAVTAKWVAWGTTPGASGSPPPQPSPTIVFRICAPGSPC